jgi:hypothetical protein
MKRYALLCLLLAFAWPSIVVDVDAQEVTVPLTAVYCEFGDTSALHHPEYATGHDYIGADMRPYSAIQFALPKQPMTNADARGMLNGEVPYQDSIGVWMSCPAGYTVSVATSWSTNDHWVVGSFNGPLEYGLYWSPFSNDPNVDRTYGGTLFATVEIHQTHGSFERQAYAKLDAACFKYLEGTLSVIEHPKANQPAGATYFNLLGEKVRTPQFGYVHPLGNNRFLIVGGEW